jgi:hypothetical protein
MAFAHKVNRVTFSGTCFSGAEIWSTGFYLGNPDSDAAVPDDAIAELISAKWQTFFTTPGSNIANTYKYDHLKIQHYNADGTQDLSVLTDKYLTTPIGGGGGSGASAPQLAMVASLRSSEARGLGSKGRMYLPGVDVAISDLTGTTTTSNTDSISLALQVMFNAIRDDAGIPDMPILASKGRTVAPTSPPVNREIRQIAVGNVYDTQRRRRNNLVEVYSLRNIGFV